MNAYASQVGVWLFIGVVKSISPILRQLKKEGKSSSKNSLSVSANADGIFNNIVTISITRILIMMVRSPNIYFTSILRITINLDFQMKKYLSFYTDLSASFDNFLITLKSSSNVFLVFGLYVAIAGW